MTDNEIIKALECCTTKGKSCKDCPAFAGVDRSDCKKFFLGALNLIARQKAEIEALIAGQETLQKYIAEKNAEIEKLNEKLKTMQAYIEQNKLEWSAVSFIEYYRKLKAEAINEYVDRLTVELIEGGIYPAFVKGKIEKVKKEMEGDAE